MELPFTKLGQEQKKHIYKVVVIPKYRFEHKRWRCLLDIKWRNEILAPHAPKASCGEGRYLVQKGKGEDGHLGVPWAHYRAATHFIYSQGLAFVICFQVLQTIKVYLPCPSEMMSPGNIPKSLADGPI